MEKLAACDRSEVKQAPWAASPARKNADTFDLAVIGGGPAGTSAAITAARAGARVLLLERGRLPRQRVCGEFISAESLALLAGLLESTAPSLLDDVLRIPEARLFFDGHVVPAKIDPPAVSIARWDLDFALWNAAENAGVTAISEITVENIAGPGPFWLQTSNAEFHARAVVNASGRWSNLRSRDRRDSTAKWLGLKGHFLEASPNRSVDLYFFEGGYCGVQPVQQAGLSEGRVNACAMVRADVARSLPEVFTQHAQLGARARQWTPLTEPVSTSPLIFHEPEPVEGEILRVGDAASFVDPFVGDGISLGLRSGALAANCLLSFFAEKTSLADAITEYRWKYRRQMLPVYRNSSKLRSLLRLPRPIRKSVGRLLEAAPPISRLLVRITR